MIMIGRIQIQTGDPSKSYLITNADISSASELGGVKIPTNQVCKHRKFEAPIKGGSKQ